MEAVWWVLGELWKHGLFANLKKCYFHSAEVHFLSYVVSSQRIYMKEEKIDTVKAYSEPKSVWDIQVFIGFANFYCRFIQGFSQILAPLTSMLKMSLQPVDALLATTVDNSKVIRSSGGSEEKSVKSDFTKPMRRAEKPSFLTSDARQAFT